MSTDSFEDVINDAINRVGDADTVGAVTGMIAGKTKEMPKYVTNQLRKSKARLEPSCADWICVFIQLLNSKRLYSGLLFEWKVQYA